MTMWRRLPHLVLELGDLVPELVDVLSGVRVVQLALDQPFLLLKIKFQTHKVKAEFTLINTLIT